MLRRLLCWCLVPALLLLVAGWALATWQVIPLIHVPIAVKAAPPSIWHFAILAAIPAGFLMRAAIALILQQLGRDNAFAFIDTLEHELTHALFGYLTFQPPVSLRASLDGEGEVLLKGQNPLNLLAPYFFPLWAWIVSVVTAALDSAYQPYGLVFSLALIGNFLFRLSAEYRWRQTDLHPYGFFFSTLLTLNLLALNLAGLAAVLGFQPIRWVMQVPTQALFAGQIVWQYLHHLSITAQCGRAFEAYLKGLIEINVNAETKAAEAQIAT